MKHVQQQNRFKKECKALLMTRMKEREKKLMLYLNFLLYFYYIFIVSVIIFYLFLGYIYLHASLYIVCVSYQLNVRSTMEIYGNKKIALV